MHKSKKIEWEEIYKNEKRFLFFVFLLLMGGVTLAACTPKEKERPTKPTESQITEAKTYEVKFFVDGKQVGQTQEVEEGKAAEAPTPPKQEGKVFIKWDKDFDSVTSDLSVNGVYNIKNYTVVFYHGVNKIGDTQIVKHGEAAEAPEPPVLVSHNFIRWDRDFDEVTSDLKINAVYEIKTY